MNIKHVKYTALAILKTQI